jgi:hypothetical protein
MKLDVCWWVWELRRYFPLTHLYRLLISVLTGPIASDRGSFRYSLFLLGFAYFMHNYAFLGKAFRSKKMIPVGTRSIQQLAVSFACSKKHRQMKKLFEELNVDISP